MLILTLCQAENGEVTVIIKEKSPSLAILRIQTIF
jgi:hypothetical protein